MRTRVPDYLLFLFIFSWVTNFSPIASAESKKPFVRQSLQEFFKDRKKVLSLVRGIREMKRRNNAPKSSAEYRTSWEYWASIHGYPGKTSPYGTVQSWIDFLAMRNPVEAPLYVGFFIGLKDLTPPETPGNLAKDTWGTCNHGTNAKHFLSWHRMYLYFFERVLRSASGDPEFALPYWDYTNNNADPFQPANTPWNIPTLFAIKALNTRTGPIPNPLFERRRTSGFGASVQLNPRQTNVDSVLMLRDFLEFQKTLDKGVHGFIHCAVGNSCLAPHMGLVPFAGNDPVFWHHHANIDRLWDCWSTRYGQEKNPIKDKNWMEEEFTFVDENGDRTKMKVSELFNPNGRIDYRYDNTSNCFRKEPQKEYLIAAFDTSEQKRLMHVTKRKEIAEASDITLNILDQEISLSPIGDGAKVRETLLLAIRPSVILPTRAILKLEDIEVGKRPGASIGVYLVNRQSGKRAFVGILSFFAMFDHKLHDKKAHKHNRQQDYVFDISAQLQELYADTPTQGIFKVALVATNGLSGEAKAVNKMIYKNAGVKIRKIIFEVEEQAEKFDIK